MSAGTDCYRSTAKYNEDGQQPHKSRTRNGEAARETETATEGTTRLRALSVLFYKPKDIVYPVYISPCRRKPPFDPLVSGSSPLQIHAPFSTRRVSLETMLPSTRYQLLPGSLNRPIMLLIALDRRRVHEPVRTRSCLT
jgi:hypothetical protein